ncbi:glycosyltransferase family 4 protein [Hippea maritima]|uniref:Glycosyl transferase family 4 n=1 Tax=Hippea maritima (strain ATCC 700847 / DSM 10411 / MH2) TaxID=760142 RepID=F2LUZ0_HIPMA|nr:glycosyltransferase [Hippea maritima]AEA34659.1 glycosyl transferase family 4 [Hippea maritima DSM 10411]
MSPLVIVSIVVFYTSLVSCLFFIYLARQKGLFLDKAKEDKPQRFHKDDTPRIGGIGIFLAFLVGSLFFANALALKLFLASLPVVIGGFLEDSSVKVNPKIRLILAFSSGFLVILFTGVLLKSLGFVFLNHLPYAVAFVFTIFAVAGVTNSINIIDGFNGLASGFSLIALTVFAVVSYQLHDKVLFEISLLLFFSTLGFFILNFPFGKIFLGDGGAYFLGFMLAELSVFLVSRHPLISPWFCLAVMIYPVWEVLFSFYRRKVLKGVSPLFPDKMHFHSVVYRSLTKSSPLTSLFVLIFVLPFEILSYFTKYRTSLSMIIILLFIISYNMTYHALVWKKLPFSLKDTKNGR